MPDPRVPFTADMVRAVLAGRKSVTRRKPSAKWKHVKAGDLMVVTEAWAIVDNENESRVAIAYRADDYDGKLGDAHWFDVPKGHEWPESHFKHDNAGWCVFAPHDKWRPPMFMPAWASRFHTRILSIRREPLQAITEDDAKREGAIWTDFGTRDVGFASFGDGIWHKCPPMQNKGWHMGGATHHEECLPTARMAFANIIDSIHGAGTWAANPEVLRVEFENPPKEG